MYLTPKIDSLKLRIDPAFVSIRDSTFLQKYQKIFIESGEISEEVNLDRHKVSIEQGINTRIGQAHFMNGEKQIAYYFVQVSSKMLKKRYFEGITKENVNEIYDYIISLNVIYLTKEDFLKSYVSDIDFAYDFECSKENLKSVIRKINSTLKDSVRKYVDNPFLNNDNIGLALNKREKATNSVPFIKIYHKSTELESKSKEFATAFLPNFDENISRLEFTVKNKKHQKYLGLSFNNLQELIDFDKVQLERILRSSIMKHYVEKIEKIKIGEGTPNEQMLKYFISKLISDADYDKAEIFKVMQLFGEETQAEKKRYRRIHNSLREIVENMSENGMKEKLDKNKKLMSVFRILMLE